jgi:hypothetical protein
LPDAPIPSPPPRAFAQGTGVFLQIVGMTLFLTTCCVCSSSGLWDPPMSKDETQEKLDQKQDPVITARRLFADPATAGLSLMVVFSTIGGLALAVFGLGLQSDKPRAAWAAVATAAVWLAILIGAGACLWIGGATVVAKVWNALLLLVATIMLGFTVAALRQVRQHPPPPGLEILPPDFEIPRFRH